jgi:hypothetical protein
MLPASPLAIIGAATLATPIPRTVTARIQPNLNSLASVALRSETKKRQRTPFAFDRRYLMDGWYRPDKLTLGL